MSSTKPKDRLDSALRRLSDAGVVEARKLLPGWWDKSMLKSEAAEALVQEALGDLAGMVGVSPVTLYEFEAPLALPAVNARFRKTAAQIDADAQVVVARQFAIEVLSASDWRAPEHLNARVLHEAVNGQGPQSLATLLDLAWSLGVPVLPMKKFGKRGFKGAALNVETFPVIALCGNESSPGELLFTIAHELGHHALGHVAKDAVVMDESLDGVSEDGTEREADAFAVQVLQGERQPLPAGCATVNDIVKAAKERAAATGIHPGHLARSWFREWLPGRLAAVRASAECPSDPVVAAAFQKKEENKQRAALAALVKPLEAGSGPAMDFVRERLAGQIATWDTTLAQRSRLRTFAGLPA